MDKESLIRHKYIEVIEIKLAIKRKEFDNSLNFALHDDFKVFHQFFFRN